MKLITRIALTALALLVVSYLIPGVVIVGLYPAIISAGILGILNAIVRPILIILTLPITILSLGLFIFVINASLFYFTSSFIDGFSVTGFFPALLGSILVSIISAVGNNFIK